jgi:hypothetical protein
VPIVQEAGWAPGPIWTGAENLASTGIRSPDRPARSQSLYQLRYPTHRRWKPYRIFKPQVAGFWEKPLQMFSPQGSVSYGRFISDSSVSYEGATQYVYKPGRKEPYEVCIPQTGRSLWMFRPAHGEVLIFTTVNPLNPELNPIC